jgi:hypothetical protein
MFAKPDHYTPLNVNQTWFLLTWTELMMILMAKHDA